MSKKREVKIMGLSYAQSSVGSYVVVLAEQRGHRKLPLILKPHDAQVIALKIEAVKAARPTMVDVLRNSFDSFGVDCQEVVIYKVAEGIFYTTILMYDGVDIAVIESTAGDALAIALTFDCPIYVEEEVLSTCGIYLDDQGNVLNDDLTPATTPAPAAKVVVSIPELEQMMNDALLSEDYELAAELRDVIAERKLKEVK